jgi:hypothetical protein
MLKREHLGLLAIGLAFITWLVGADYDCDVTRPPDKFGFNATIRVLLCNIDWTMTMTVIGIVAFALFLLWTLMLVGSTFSFGVPVWRKVGTVLWRVWIGCVRLIVRLRRRVRTR